MMDDSFWHELYVICAECLSVPVFLTNFAVFVSTFVILNSTREDLRIATILLGNIAFADMCMPLSILFGLFVRYRSSLFCAVELGATVTCTLTSMCCIVLIAVDRYFFIVHSIRYDHYMTETRARMLINLSWFLGILFGFVPITMKAIYKTEEQDDCRFVTPENVDVMLIAGAFAFPLLVATFALYMAIYLKARAVSKAMWPAVQKTGVHRLKTRSVIIVFLSSSCFLLTWGPYLVSLMIYGSLCGWNEISERREVCFTLEELMASPLPMLGFLNSFMNPIIFAWWHRPFTNALHEIVCPSRLRKTTRTKSVDVSTITTTS
uniref:5-hydroxytryptamine receptor 1B n=1 Tax=Lygus hesperus TaxID=30085 RepID=A0A0A9W859_LYGHE